MLSIVLAPTLARASLDDVPPRLPGQRSGGWLGRGLTLQLHADLEQVVLYHAVQPLGRLEDRRRHLADLLGRQLVAQHVEHLAAADDDGQRSTELVGQEERHAALEGLDALVGIAAVRFATGQARLHRGHQLLVRDRLRQVVVGAQPHCGAGMVLRGQTRQEQEGCRGQVRIGPKRLEHGVAVHPRHVHVAHDEVRPGRPRGLDARGTARRLDDLVAGLAEDLRIDVAQERVVVYQQQLRHAPRLPRAV